jgi:hypothetical protein
VISRDRSLREVAAIASEHLKKDGMSVVVVGGSAITSHDPTVYTSHDIDFAVLTGVSRKQISASLQRLGFREDGREFVHKNSKFSLDFVADTPYVDRRPIREFTTVRTAYGTYRTLTAEDAIADRVAGFIHWNDRQGLDVAERLVTALSRRLRPKRLFDAIDDIEVGDAASRERLEFARRRVRELLEVRK